MADDDKKSIQVRNNELVGGGGNEVDKIISEAAKNLSMEQKGDLAKYAIKKRIDLDADRANRETKYTHANQQISDHLAVVDNLQNNKSGPLSRNVVKTTVDSGAGKTEVISKDGAACFVATATYGNSYHPNVVALRHWRDSSLSKTVGGRLFIAIYWKIGPLLAKIVDKSKALRIMSEKVLDVIAGIVAQKDSGSK